MPSMLRRAYSQVSDRSTSACPSRVARGVVDSLEAVEIDRDDGQVSSARAQRANSRSMSVRRRARWNIRSVVAESFPLELVSGSRRVDHREVNQSDDRLLSGPTRPGRELHELFDHENGQANGAPHRVAARQECARARSGLQGWSRPRFRRSCECSSPAVWWQSRPS